MENPYLEIGVLGAGSWGTALSLLLAGKGHRVDLWVYEEDLCDVMKLERENRMYLPGFQLPDAIRPSSSLQDVVANKKVLLVVVPTHVLRSTLNAVKSFIDPDCLIINASKGIENDSLLPIHKIIQEVIPHAHSLATLSGPTFAKEVAQGIPSAIVAAADRQETAERVQAIFDTDKLKVFTSTDLMGVEIGGALKNVIAIATGIADGLQLGFNPRAALINRGLVEIIRIGTAMGAKPETFSGLSGMGDLVLTCTGDLSRNRTVGLKLGKGLKLAEITASMNMVAEGIRTVTSAYQLKNKFDIQASIIAETYRVLHEGKSPQQALQDVMNVETTSEFSGIKGLE
jgi:glycerol-3-phosphate dehydrogenase (NAD(P)+)